MLNAYQLGFLAAQPQVFTKAASLQVLRTSVLSKYAMITPEGRARMQEAIARDAAAAPSRQVDEMLAHKSPGLPSHDIPVPPEARRPGLTDPEFYSPLTDKPAPAPAPEGLGTRAGKAIDEGAAYAGEKAKGGWDWLKQKATDIGTGAKGFSSDVNVALGGAKDKHTRTLMALAALLAAGGGAYALGRSGGGEGKRERA